MRRAAALALVFPTHVGVNRQPRAVCPLLSGIPHARGGEPRVRGLLERTDNLEKLAQELGAWRHDINTSIRMGLIYLRILVALLGLVGLAAWQAPLSAIIAAISGG